MTREDSTPTPPEGIAPGIQLEWLGLDVQGGRIGLFLPKDPDALLDALTQEEYDRADQRMPYWAVLWPSAKALAAVVLAGPNLVGKRVLDLGCGLGLVGLTALERGATTTFLDWEANAVALARASAQASGLSDGTFVVADWRSPPPPLGTFDRILGADVLYEERNAPGVAVFLAAHLSPGGEAWITDPGRLHAERFAEVLVAHGLRVVSRTRLPAIGETDRVTLFRIAGPPPPSP